MRVNNSYNYDNVNYDITNEFCDDVANEFRISNAVSTCHVLTNRSLIDFRLKKEGARSGPFTFGTTSCAREICVFAGGLPFAFLAGPTSDQPPGRTCIRRHSASSRVVYRPARIRAAEICRERSGGGPKEMARRSKNDKFLQQWGGGRG